MRGWMSTRAASSRFATTLRSSACLEASVRSALAPAPASRLTTAVAALEALLLRHHGIDAGRDAGEAMAALGSAGRPADDVSVGRFEP